MHWTLTTTVILTILWAPAPTSATNYRVAWLAPESRYIKTKAGSTIGALQKAINTVESSILTSDTISVTWKDTDCDGRQAISAAYNVLVVDGYDPDIVLGPPCTSSMTYVGGYAGYNNLPIFGWLSDSSTLEDKSFYNSLVRVYGPINAIADSLLMMLDKFGWNRVELLSSDSYASLGQGVYDALIDANFTVVRWQQDLEDNPSENKIQSYYERLKTEARILILAVPPSKLRRWMLVAHDEDMVSGDYAFIYLNNEIPSKDVKKDWFSKDMWQGNDGRNEDALQAFTNVLVLLQSLKHVNGLNNFLDESDAAAASSSLPANLSITATSSDVTSPFLHDALLLWATLVSEVGGSDDGEALLEQARNREFTDDMWATGDVYLDENGDRKPEFWLLDLNEKEKFHKALETELSLRGGSIRTRVQVVEQVRWGDGTTGISNAPPDVPVCGWENEKCPNLALYIAPPVVIGVLIIVAIVIFFIVRKYQFEQSLKTMKWKINKDELKFRHDKKGMGSAFLRMSHASVRHSKSSHLGRDKTDSQSRSTEGEQAQIFIPVAKYKGAMVAIRNVRKQRIKVDRAILVEMRQMTDMKHANVVQFTGAVVDPPEIMEVWDYCTKGGLQDVIWNDNIGLDDMFKFSLVTDILKGIKYIHGSPFKYHGQLRSSSCLVDGRWACKITDYGLRHFLHGEEEDPDTSDFKKMTRLFWVAPEYLRETVDKNDPSCMQAADVYAVAVIIKEIFARNGPYTEYQERDDYEPEDILDRVKQCDVHQPFRPDLREARDRIPDRLNDVIKRGWADNPDERPSASSMLRDVQRVNPSKASNVVDNMIQMMEKYSTNLEQLVGERMKEVEDEKKRSDMLLYKMLPKSVAEDLRVGKTVAPEAFEAVSIYFSDIVSFTKLAAQSTPMQVVDMLNSLYTTFDSITEQHDVYKVETIGDAYMYVSGLPLRNGDNHAVEVTNCAMDLLSHCMEFKVAHLPEYVLTIRIGLHTGPVVAGVVGITMPRYCLFGESVTTASKMESGGAPMRIHLSETTYKYLSKFSGYHLADRGPMEIKGKGNMRTYFLVSRDGYEQPYPSYDQLSADDKPQPTKLPVTKGKVQRSAQPTRPSTESGFYEPEIDISPGTPRKISAGQVNQTLGDIKEKTNLEKQNGIANKEDNKTVALTNGEVGDAQDKENKQNNNEGSFQDSVPKPNVMAWRREESVLGMSPSHKAARKQSSLVPPNIADILVDDLEDPAAL